jgi:hypothetical protein
MEDCVILHTVKKLSWAQYKVNLPGEESNLGHFIATKIEPIIYYNTTGQRNIDTDDMVCKFM